MDLFISPLSCSLAVHIVCLEADVPFTLHRVNRKTKQLESDKNENKNENENENKNENENENENDYRSIAPQGNVPAIRLPDGSILTETAAVLQYIADLKPATSLAPRWGTPERYRLIEWIHFVSTELHKKHLAMVFSSKTPDAVKQYAALNADPALSHVERHLSSSSSEKPFLLGSNFTVADAYLFWALTVAPYGGIALDKYPSLQAYAERIRSRPSVKEAFKTELPLYIAEVGTPPSLPTQSAQSAA